MMENHTDDYRALLRQKYEERVLRNPRYSQRAFARDLGISPQHLSRLLSGHLGLSPSNAAVVGERLSLSESELQLFVALVESQHARTERARKNGQLKVEQLQSKFEFAEISETSPAIRDWYTLPVYVLYSLPEAESSPEWVAKRLGIPIKTAEETIHKLVSEQLLETNSDGRLMQTSRYFHLNASKSTDEIRSFYTEMLDRAQDAIHSVPMHQRALSVGYLTICDSDFPELKKMIDDFCLESIRKMGERNSKQARVYALSTQIFPVDQGPGL
jgi:uncharacterized protein (TIGR02147 family)